MNIKNFFSFSFKYKIVIHQFNGNVISIRGGVVINSENDKNKSLQEETVLSLIRLAQILRPIYMRITEKGYYLDNQKLVRIEQKL